MENETIPNDSEVSENSEVIEPNTEPTGTTDTSTEPQTVEETTTTVEDDQLQVLLHIDARLERLEGIQVDNLSYSIEFSIVTIAFLAGAFAFKALMGSWFKSLN